MAGPGRPRKETPSTSAEVAQTPEYNEVERQVEQFNKRWDGAGKSVIRRNRSEQNQIRELLEVYLKKIFGREYVIGFFLESDMGERLSQGYQALNVGDFPNSGGKASWNDGIATSMKLINAEDGSIRWGSRRELRVCVIPKFLREREKQQLEKETSDQMSKHGIKPGKGRDTDDGTDYDVEVTKESAAASF